MLMRSVKALIVSGHFDNMIQNHESLKKQLEKQFEISEGKMYSSAELALQLVVHASKKLNYLVQIPPTRLQYPIFNDEKARLTYESATAFLYAKEPLQESPLFQLPNVVTAPHIGSATLETRKKMVHLAYQNLIDALEDRQPRYLVNPKFE
jgi:hypothetical protein